MKSSSVVICAYTTDRWEDLKAAAESACSGSSRPDELIIVIDHNDALLSRARHHFSEGHLHSSVSVVPNANRRGLSGARNTGVDIATSDVIMFLDDDATVEPEWLARLLQNYSDPAVVAVGGSALPVWPESTEKVRPALFPSSSEDAWGELDWVLGCTYNGQPESAAPVRNLMGCNMSFRRDLFNPVTRFNENLGRLGRIPLGGEETEFCIRIQRLDPVARIVFDPAAVARHRVGADRARWSYLASRCFSEGLSKASISKIVGPQVALASERNYVRQVLAKAVVRELSGFLRGRKEGLIGATAIMTALAAASLGYLRGSLAWRKGPKPDADSSMQAAA
jgi:glycosyltransferase involved in cell wall biosynthesis